jgi:hypothetical protein
MTLPITGYEAEGNFSKLAVLKNKIRSTILQERLNYLSILSIKNHIAEPLSYEEATKEHAAKKCRKKSITELCQAVN